VRHFTKARGARPVQLQSVAKLLSCYKAEGDRFSNSFLGGGAAVQAGIEDVEEVCQEVVASRHMRKARSSGGSGISSRDGSEASGR